MIFLSQEKFEEIVDKAVAEIPKNFLSKLKNVAIMVQDYPSPGQLQKLKIGRRALILGLYEGIPQTKRWGRGQIFPDRITIFKRSIEIIASSEEDLDRIVKNVVKHEIAHHFGMNEEEIRRAGK